MLFNSLIRIIRLILGRIKCFVSNDRYMKARPWDARCRHTEDQQDKTSGPHFHIKAIGLRRIRAQVFDTWE